MALTKVSPNFLNRLTSDKLPAGSVIQIQQARKTDTWSTSSTSFQNIDGLTLTLTPNSINSKFLVEVSLFVGALMWSTNGGYLGVSANGTSVAGNGSAVWTIQYGADVGNSPYETIQWTDSATYAPNSISPITFNAQIATANASYAIWLNRAYNNNYGTQGRSVLTVTEIAG